ncbi:hypothetical protein [Methylobacterium sp. E-066]|uniref:hypothetical protein n=1 Tax=Methylobacterium sp. E-066 TaxID=2836584 RepID=UPI001FBB13B4|nr:hypothetical protein [Methylobacterium sp. E-066]MCJ2143202.1 hypothetical protein [Methylobacterium sp. E-066]
MRLDVPTIAIRRTVGDLYEYLQDRKEIGSFRFGLTPTGMHTITFQPKEWLFSAKLSFWRVRPETDGTKQRGPHRLHAYRGNAEVILNPTRLFAHLAAEVSAGRVPTLTSYELQAWPDRTHTLREQTLDGSDNVIPENLIAAAIRLNWPQFVQDYADGVTRCLEEKIGLVHDVGGDWETAPDKDESLLVMPAAATWSLRQVEHYQEYKTVNAIEVVRRVEPYALSLSRSIRVRQYQNYVRTETMRQDNARSLSMSLDRQGAYLVLYAKTLDRVRVEVRFQKEPAAISGLQSTGYARRPNGMAELLSGTSAEAAKRLARWVAEFQECIPRGAPAHKLVMLIDHLSAVCGSGPLLTKVLSILLAHGGIIPTGHADLDHLVPQLIRRRLLIRVRSTQTRNVAHYRLRTDFAGMMRSIRDLGQAGPRPTEKHYPP